MLDVAGVTNPVSCLAQVQLWFAPFFSWCGRSEVLQSLRQCSDPQNSSFFHNFIYFRAQLRQISFKSSLAQVGSVSGFGNSTNLTHEALS